MTKPEGERPCDKAAKDLLGTSHSFVFMMPTRAVLEQDTYDLARDEAANRNEPGLSRQAYALRTKVLEVDQIAPSNPHVFEAHPEVSFFLLNRERQLAGTKRTWNGLLDRRRLLAEAGIHLPDRLPVAKAAPDDVLDAAAAAWTAARAARGEARSFPDNPPVDFSGRLVAIRA